MPGKSQSHTDAVLNVLRGSVLAGVTPYVGLFSVAPAETAAGTELAGAATEAGHHVRCSCRDGNARQVSTRTTSSWAGAREWRGIALGVRCVANGSCLLGASPLPRPSRTITASSRRDARGGD
jgi:hypothetical protein